MYKEDEAQNKQLTDKASVDRWFEKMNRQFEEDAKTHDFSLSKEWDEDFQRTMFGTATQKKTKKSRKLLYAAAGIAAVVAVGLGITQNEVIAESLEEIFNHKSQVGDSSLDHFGTKEEMSAGENGYDKVFTYKDKTLTEVYQQIKDTLKRPFFR